MAVYTVSDLHGYYDVFEEGIRRIGFQPDDFLYVIGDAIDRGPEGIEILSCIMRHENMDLIIGNHEFMMLNAVDPGGRAVCSLPDTDLWLYYNGGEATFDQYYDLTDAERKELLSWMRGRYVIKTLDIHGKPFCLTHSYYMEGFENRLYDELDYEEIWQIVWGSIYRRDETRVDNIYKNYDYTFITGHVPVQRARSGNYMRWKDGALDILRNGNLIDIDGGCAMGCVPGLRNGALFLRLDDMEVFPVRMKQDYYF